MADIEIEVDGKTLTAAPNEMIIQVTDRAGIYIPRFCYHKHLSIAANCRMCLVEVEKAPKTLPACATPVTPGMKVFTKSPKALASQKAVMEFLLINHPLDCPICDQGGECELQDLSMGFGSADSFYNEGKRSVKDKDIGPLISTEMTRCIQCTRCVRFGSEIAGIRELGALGRGGELEIGTYIDHAMESEVSGNVIDICPVGALTSKPFRFTARAWELQQRPSVSPHDCLGTNVHVHTRSGKVMRVVPRENASINETWIADRDRYSYQALYHEDRVTQPMIKKSGKWQAAEWQEALEFAISGLQRVLSANGAFSLGALASANATLEELYLFQKLVRGIGSPHIDHRLRQTDFRLQDKEDLYPGLHFSLETLEASDLLFLIGSNIQKEQPIASLRVRRASLKGSKILALNAVDYDFHFALSEKCIVAPDEMVDVLARIANALLTNPKQPLPENIRGLLATHPAGEKELAMAKALSASENACLILGAVALDHPEAQSIRHLAEIIAHLSKAKCGLLTQGANAAAAYITGVLPHRAAAGAAVPLPGLDAQSMLKEARKAYLLLNLEPDLDVANPQLMREALCEADFVVSLSLYHNALLSETADVILPIAAFTETAGTYINAMGDWQSVTGVANAYEASRPAWKILRVLGNMLHLEGFDYDSSETVLQEVKALTQDLPEHKVNRELILGPDDFKSKQSSGLVRMGTQPIYSVDAMSRRASALQAAQGILEAELAAVCMNTQTASRLKLEAGSLVNIQQGEARLRLKLMIDDRLADRAVMLPSGILETRELSELFGQLEIS